MNRFLSAVLLGVIAMTAEAATINVSTTADVVDAGPCGALTVADLENDPGADGFVSLREAVCAANDDRDEDLIVLPAGTYALMLGGSGEDNNEEGDLDVTRSLRIRGAGVAETVIENGIGDPGIDGDGDRVIDVRPPTTLDVDLILEDLTVRNGDVACTGEGCFTGAGGIFFASTGTLDLRRTDVLDNATSCTGACCGDAHNTGGILVENFGNLRISDATISGNTSFCAVAEGAVCADAEEEAGCLAGSAAILMDCDANRTPECSDTRAAGREIQATFQRVDITGNMASCEGAGCDTDELVSLAVDYGADRFDITMIDVRVADNVMTCNGDNCDGEQLFEVNGGNLSPIEPSGDHEFRRFQLEDNVVSCTGVGCNTEELIEINFGQTLSLTDSSVSRNTLTCTGVDCDVDEVFEFEQQATGSTLTLLRTTFSDNRIECLGDECDSDELFAFDSGAFRKTLSITDSFFLRNVLTCTGFDCDTDELLDSSAGGDKLITDTVFADNVQICDGVDCDVDELVGINGEGGDRILERVQVVRNRNECAGDGCDTEEIVKIGASNASFEGVVRDSQITDNTSSCTGVACTCSIAGVYFDGGARNLVEGSTLARNVAIGDDSVSSECLEFGTGGVAVDNPSAETRIINTTIADNRTSASGAAIKGTGTFVLSQVTLVDNVSDADDNGVGEASICAGVVDGTCGVDAQTLTLDNAIVFGNVLGDGSTDDCAGPVVSAGNNVFAVDTNCATVATDVAGDPLLGMLQDNGCAATLPDGSCVETQRPLNQSPAIDAGDCTLSGLTDDQRGFARPGDDTCDIGAVELVADDRRDVALAYFFGGAGDPFVGANFGTVYEISNAGEEPIVFPTGTVVLRVALPATGIAFDDPQIGSFSLISGSLDCGIDAALLECVSVDEFTLSSPSSSLSVSVEVSVNAAAAVTIPADEMTCTVDPDGAIREVDETNNTCDTIAFSTREVPALAVASQLQVSDFDNVVRSFQVDDTIGNAAPLAFEEGVPVRGIDALAERAGGDLFVFARGYEAGTGAKGVDAGGAILAALDPAAGLTAIGATGLVVRDAAFDDSGVLYVAAGDGLLYTVDVATGVATARCDIGGLPGLAWDSTGGRLLALGNSELEAIDVGSFPASAADDCASTSTTLAPSLSTVEAAAFVGGQLLAANENGELLLVDPNDGATAGLLNLPDRISGLVADPGTLPLPPASCDTELFTAVSAEGTDSMLFGASPDTGALTFVGTLPTIVTSLTYDPSLDRLVGLGQAAIGSGEQVLFTADPCSAEIESAVTVVDEIFEGLAIDANGVVLGARDEDLFEIDRVTGATAPLGGDPRDVAGVTVLDGAIVLNVDAGFETIELAFFDRANYDALLQTLPLSYGPGLELPVAKGGSSEPLRQLHDLEASAETGLIYGLLRRTERFLTGPEAPNVLVSVDASGGVSRIGELPATARAVAGLVEADVIEPLPERIFADSFETE
ncbi:MAG: choice-of-anchor Q domain-containing protein [Pseudomonadota bacterium]